ncbi:DUF3015 family protein [Candidatus Nitrospira bockiana]
MQTSRRLAWSRILILAGVALTASACNTTKATVDTMVRFFSSTTPQSVLTVDGLVDERYKVAMFAGLEYDNLQADAARGGGEYLDSFGTLLRVPSGSLEEFGDLAQHQYASWFTAPDDAPRARAERLMTAAEPWIARQR